MLNIVLFGPPGAGKGTQSKKLCDTYHLIHLSTGDLLRDEISRGTALGLQAKSVMDKGELVSDEVVIAMIDAKLNANPQTKGFIFDGFPRTQAQAKALDELLEKRKAPINMMVALEVNDEELLHRLLLRGADSGRPDDRDENVIRRRIFNYNNQTAPLKQYYSIQKKFHSVYGMGSIDDIFDLLCATIDNKTQAKKPHYDGMVTVADVSMEDEPAKHLKDIADKPGKKIITVKTARKPVSKKTAAKPAKKAVAAKKKQAVKAKPVAKKAKVVKVKAAKKKSTPKKSKAVAKKTVKKLPVKKVLKKAAVKKTKASVLKKALAKKKTALKKVIKKSSKRRK
jgi:adenylate kinase